MRINFKLNEKEFGMDINSHEPLSFTIREINGIDKELLSCKKNNCGHCIVLNKADNEILLSCITPAFKLKDAEIITPSYFYATRAASIIKSAYKEVHRTPCSSCIEQRSLLFEWIASFLDRKNVRFNNERDSFFYRKNEEEFEINKKTPELIVADNSSFIISTTSLIRCDCLTHNDILKITEAVLVKRRKSIV